jgi:hypothetical protein
MDFRALPPQRALAPGRALSRRQSEGRCELPRARECANILNTCSNRGGVIGPIPGTLISRRHDGAVARGDLVVEGQLTDDRREDIAYAKRMELSPCKIAAASA